MRRRSKTRRHFSATYYAPNNAVLALVGNFKSETALALIKKYFENIPAQAPPAAPDMTEPAQQGERRKSIEDSFAQTPRLDIVYKIPPGNTPDWYALDVLGNVLSSGVSSRLYQKFVKEKELALSVFCRRQRAARSGALLVQYHGAAQTDLGELERLLQDEIAPRAKPEHRRLGA